MFLEQTHLALETICGHLLGLGIFRAFKISFADRVQQQDRSASKVRRLEHQFKCMMIYEMINIKPLVNIQGIMQIDFQ